MNELVQTSPTIPAMTPERIEKVRELETRAAMLPQEAIVTHHVLHGGVYLRTISIPAGVLLTGAEICVPTTLIFSGHALVTVGEHTHELAGYRVLPASAGRKQVFLALAHTDLTMVFATKASTIEEAENEFTREADRLFSRYGQNVITITGE